jgi:uncharacterized protein
MDSFFKDVINDVGIKIAVIGVLAILALFLLVQTISTAQNFGTSANPPTSTITVTGEGNATAVPDTATISFGGTVTASNVADAESQLTNTMKAALTVLKDNGVDSADINTSSYNVSPHYVPPSCPPGIACAVLAPGTSGTSGYDVSETITVKIHDTSKVSAILGGLAKANVTQVTGPDYVVGDPSAVQSQARGKAIQDAQKQAATLASQLGVHLGKVVSFSDNSGGGPRPMMAAEGSVVSSAAVNPAVPVGNNEYTDDVSITYAIN